MESKIRNILKGASEDKKILFLDILERLDLALPDGITRPKGLIVSARSYKALGNSGGMKISIPVIEGIQPGDRFTWEKHPSGVLLLVPENL